MESTQNYDKDKLYDVIVIGGGPAGLTAALYLARAKYRVLVLEKEQFGGQITITHEVVNYPGIGKASGKEITETMRRQGEFFGAEFLLAEATHLEAKGDIKTVKTDKGDFYCLGILIATGAHPRAIGFKGEAEHKGRGVAYCATCDGEFFTGKEIFVVGGGYAAAEESVFLTKFARHVTILIRGDDFTCAAAVAEPAKQHKNITILTNTVVEEVSGEGGLNYIRYKNTKTEKITEYRADDGDFFGVFVLAGYTPDTKIVKGLVELNDHGYIVTDSEQRTSIDGIYAAGDVCIKPLRQVVTATGDGALAATELEKHVASVQNRTGISAPPPASKNYNLEETVKSSESQYSPDELLSEDMKAQLRTLFEKMQGNAILKLYLDKREISRELENYMRELASLSNKLTVDRADVNASSDFAPCVMVCRADGAKTGLAFHGVPGGHEFSSFVLGIYNAMGPGQPIDDETRERIGAISKPTDIKVLVSLSCTMCPDTVVSAQHIAAKNKNVTAEIYDIHHFEEIRKQYNVMSVPCILINDSSVSFGKKNIEQILELIG
ncbi:MAG: FAD-dependent oxidoreductase [Ruminococcaceae bacterium]|nr:FAD-dependent oxidoreductase [Oscillospiraceae bacterium]